MTKQEFIQRGYAGHFLDDAKAVADYCRGNYKDQASEVIAYADKFCQHEFLFNTEHDLEQLDDPVCYGEKIQWDYNPGGDPEYVWQFNRHRYFITLGQAYQLTGDEKYAKCYADMLKDWILTNPLTEENKKTTWRILEAGFRGEYWTKAFYYFKDSSAVTDELVALFEECLHEHARYLISMHSPYRLISNWGVIENHGLFEIALTLPRSETTKEYIRTAIDHLEKLARMAVMPDGVEWEQSPMYHNEVLKCYLDVILLADRNGITLPKTIRDCAKRMAYANLIWQKPDHHEFMMGDSDDFDISSALCRAAYCFSDGVLKCGAYEKVDFETAWDIGIEGIRTYEALPVKEPEFVSAALGDTGNYYFRSDWSRTANLMHLHCGTIGAGHGHSDQLHIDLVANGEDVLMDGGRYTYVFGEKRCEYKDPTMHNTITVDGKLFTVCKDSWECSRLSAPVKQQFVIGDRFEFVQAGHLGYMPEGVFVNRKIVYLRPDIYIVMDECYATGRHTYESYFHFNNAGSVTLEKNRVHYQGKHAEAVVSFVSGNTALTKKTTHLSRRYNHEEENETVTAAWSGEGFTSCMTVIWAGAKGELPLLHCEKIPVSSALKGTTYPDAMAEAVKLTLDGKEYVIIFCHQEVNSPTDLVEADGCLGFGNVIVFDKEEMTEVGHTLHW